MEFKAGFVVNHMTNGSISVCVYLKYVVALYYLYKHWILISKHRTLISKHGTLISKHGTLIREHRISYLAWGSY